MRSLIVASSVIIFQREENRFPATIGRSSPYLDEQAKLTTVLEMPPLEDKYSRRQEVLWGPGAEATAACLLIDRAPAMKHDVWDTVYHILSDIPHHPCHTEAIITILDKAASMERKTWRQLRVLESAQTLESVIALDMEAILASMCDLAGVAARRGDSINAVGELHYNLSDDMALLRRIHQRLKKLSSVPEPKSAKKLHAHPETVLQEQLGRFKNVWTTIVEQLSPGRLANEMSFYADTMEDLVDEDERYAFEEHDHWSEEQWAEQMSMTSLRRGQLFQPNKVLSMEITEGFLPV
ncbi:hypothetical protein TgHK011_002220 [Trichoderma gracile]|nr:hypothetical protein TgHK011_002220 [Trichoderma gracile]